MSNFTKNRKVIIFEVEINDDRETVNVMERIAKILGVEIGQNASLEYVRLMYERPITARYKEGATNV